jgi:hypothetical protein
VKGGPANQHEAGTFEVIVGKSQATDVPAKCFGFVRTYDSKPRRRVFETLKAQGLQMNQAITFLSDGGDTVRDLQFYLSPHSEHILDWFHVTMRLTVMRQMAKGLPQPPALGTLILDPNHELERIKWFLWHGNTFQALQLIDDLATDLDDCQEECAIDDLPKLLKAVQEFLTYITANRDFIPNYGERYRHAETISTAFVESTVNYVLSKRFVKKQQMRWTQAGAHLLLQVRLQVINNDWRKVFCRWYPGLKPEPDYQPIAA